MAFDTELKKGGIEMLVLSLVQRQSRHGYEIAKLIEVRSGGKLTFALASVYPTLLRMESRGLIKGRWVEEAGTRRRCYYEATEEGLRELADRRETWKAYVLAVNQVMELDHA